MKHTFLGPHVSKRTPALRSIAQFQTSCSVSFPPLLLHLPPPPSAPMSARYLSHSRIWSSRHLTRNLDSFEIEFLSPVSLKPVGENLESFQMVNKVSSDIISSCIFTYCRQIKGTLPFISIVYPIARCFRNSSFYTYMCVLICTHIAVIEFGFTHVKIL